MNPLNVFFQLKNDVLLTYQKQYPYFEGTWKTFSSQDIQNLIDLIAVQVKQTVSEKWIYTHLKSETNAKLPRKDMLDILSQLVGYSGWDEYVFKAKQNEIVVTAQPKKKRNVFLIGIVILALFLVGFLSYQIMNKEEIQTIDQTFKNKNQGWNAGLGFNLGLRFGVTKDVNFGIGFESQSDITKIKKNGTERKLEEINTINFSFEFKF